MNKRRRERLASALEEDLPLFFREECDFSSGELISILYIEIVESGAKANIFVSVFPDSAKEQVVRELKMRENEATSFIRARLGSKYSPVVRFHVR